MGTSVLKGWEVRRAFQSLCALSRLLFCHVVIGDKVKRTCDRNYHECSRSNFTGYT